MQVSWNFFKSIIILKNSQYQSVEELDRYMLSIFDNSYGIFCFIQKTTPKNLDQIDFEDNYLAGANQRIENLVKNIINVEGTQGSLSVGTSAIEVKVSTDRLINRKIVSVYNNSNAVLYWGFTSSVTPGTGSPIQKKQLITWDVGDGLGVYLIAETSGNNVRITEAS